jgi:sterol 3beta-glucosyltransferase
MRSFKGIVSDWRRSELGLDDTGPLWDGGKRMMYGYSPIVVPNPDDWPPTARAVGYWLPDPVAGWDDPALAAFIDGGTPPVYIGFGSNVDDDPVALGRLVSDAVHQAGVRAVVQAGQGLIESESSDGIYVTGPLPHSWLFPKMACVVHHGGSGTTGEAIRARRPQVIVPFTTDQPFWATRMRHLGVSPEPFSRKRLTVEHLAESIVRATTDPSITRAATEVGDRVLAEDGIAGAAEYLSALTSTPEN